MSTNMTHFSIPIVVKKMNTTVSKLRIYLTADTKAIKNELGFHTQLR